MRGVVHLLPHTFSCCGAEEYTQFCFLIYSCHFFLPLYVRFVSVQYRALFIYFVVFVLIALFLLVLGRMATI
jgi:hypothetical protein